MFHHLMRPNQFNLIKKSYNDKGISKEVSEFEFIRTFMENRVECVDEHNDLVLVSVSVVSYKNYFTVSISEIDT